MKCFSSIEKTNATVFNKKRAFNKILRGLKGGRSVRIQSSIQSRHKKIKEFFIRMTIDAAIDLFVKSAMGKKAHDLVVLDVQELTSIADVFIICSGRSNRQVTALSEHILFEMKQRGIPALSREGVKEGHWAILDYGHVVIHIFYDPLRSFYDLEGLWADADRIETPSMSPRRTSLREVVLETAEESFCDDD